MPEVRFHDADDIRREAAVEMLKRHVRATLPVRDAGMYDADLEYMDRAIIAFADEWAKGLVAALDNAYGSVNGDELAETISGLGNDIDGNVSVHDAIQAVHALREAE
jgi:hypothetical protein